MFKLIFGSLITMFLFGLNKDVKIIPPEEIKAVTPADTLTTQSLTRWAIDLGFEKWKK